MPQMVNPDLLVGMQTMDDAAVYRIRDDLAVVLSADIFTPIVDDAFSFGEIAAANALSDLYAMGATPLLALNLAGWPRNKLPFELLGDIQRGAANKVAEARAVIGGGHSIDDPEPKFGLVVLGTAHPDAITQNIGARPDDLLVLTKPLGTGIVTTAIKHDEAGPDAVTAAIDSMRELNEKPALLARQHGAHAVTDVTGYGLLGHLKEMLEASGVSADINAARCQALPDVWPLIKKGHIPGGTMRNLHAINDDVSWHPKLEEAHKILLADAQTSGGLLIAIPPEDQNALSQALARDTGREITTIGRIKALTTPLITVLADEN
ncbi:MAG: selenide, water dikinase SelD [Chloroflexi bacterium]|nr:selenide, water dikinase SelD [Chloroflexota bacterium]HCU72502.1 selenide, water dikinase SelD [Chloroflexota bacterium]|tara:strand:+ start:218 stop:1180 length:963 start_codon:yes stop_codon:yes gene_type:complete